jgi:hypothetical protein
MKRMTNTSLYAVAATGSVTNKIDIISGAYSQLRISGITRSPTPEDLEVALCRLENMAAEWSSTSDDAGFFFEDEPDPNSPSGLIRAYRNAYETNLAIRLIPDFNKVVPVELKMMASQSLSNLIGRLAAQRMQQVGYPSRQPIGSGNSYRYSRWARFYRAGGNPPNASTSDSMFFGDVRDYTEHYDSYLNSGEVIASYSIVVDTGLTVETESLTSPDISYRIKGGTSTSNKTNNVYQVTIIATTDAGRVDARRRFIQVSPTGATY